MTTPISADTEARLIDAGKEVIRLTNDGFTPNAALTKVATDYGYGPDFIERIAQMYNTSRTLRMMKEAKGQVKRAIDHPLADAAEVISNLFVTTSEKSAAVSNRVKASLDYDPMAVDCDSFVKAAAEKTVAPGGYLSDPKLLMKRAYNILDASKREVGRLNTRVAGLEESRLVYLQKAAAHFRSMDHTPFEEVERRVSSAHGQLGKMAMAAVWASLGGAQRLEKRSSAESDRPLHVPSQSPYLEIAEFIKLSADRAVAVRQAAALDGAVGELAEDIRDRARQLCGEKSASMASIVQYKGLNELLDSVMDNTDAEAAKRKAAVKALDPVHQADLRSVGAQSTLNDLMSNDPVISQYAPSEITDAYNEIASLSPNSSIQPAVIRGYLRRFLESSPQPQGRLMDTFEAGQISDLEKKISPPAQQAPQAKGEAKK
jgi:hypothetical protein